MTGLFHHGPAPDTHLSGLAGVIGPSPAPGLPGEDVAFHQSHDFTGLDFLITRKAYGHFLDDGYAGHLAQANAVHAIAGAYDFLRPGHVDPIGSQVQAFTAGTNPALMFLDCEEDSGPGFNNGMVSLAEIDAAFAACRVQRIDPMPYGSLGVLFSQANVNHFVHTLHARALWVAAYGITLPDYVLHCGVPIFHQVSDHLGATSVDVDRFYGTIEQLRALAGLSTPKVSPTTGSFNLAPGLAKYEVIVRPGRDLLDPATLKHRGTVGQDLAHRTYPFLGSYATHHVIADGDYSALVARADTEQVVAVNPPVGYGA